MASPKKTLLVEQISYAEEALGNLKAQLYRLFQDIESEYDRVLDELKNLEDSENNVDEETFDRVNRVIQRAWTEAMSCRKRLNDLDSDLHELDKIMSKRLDKLRSERNQY